MSNGRLYFVTTEQGQYVMTAPMSTLVIYLKLHPDAVRRIERETATLGAQCTLWHNAFGDKKVFKVERLEDATPSPQQENRHAEG